MIPATKIQYETPEGFYYHFGDDLLFISREEIDAVERSGDSIRKRNRNKNLFSRCGW